MWENAKGMVTLCPRYPPLGPFREGDPTILWSFAHASLSLSHAHSIYYCLDLVRHISRNVDHQLINWIVQLVGILSIKALGSNPIHYAGVECVLSPTLHATSKKIRKINSTASWSSEIAFWSRSTEQSTGRSMLWTKSIYMYDNPNLNLILSECNWALLLKLHLHGFFLSV